MGRAVARTEPTHHRAAPNGTWWPTGEPAAKSDRVARCVQRGGLPWNCAAKEAANEPAWKLRRRVVHTHIGRRITILMAFDLAVPRGHASRLLYGRPNGPAGKT